MKLLVSVRDMAEAAMALEAGVDLLDLKEPRAGSLGATDSALWQSARELAAERVPVSAALGELRDWNSTAHGKTDCLQGLQFAKIGLSSMGSRADWPTRWREFGESLPSGVQPVAVAYADWQAADAPSVEQVMQQAEEFQWRTWLIDTFDKQQGRLLEHLSLEEIERIITRASASGSRLVLAGSLDTKAIESIASLDSHPDYIAVRGAVCSGGRESSLVAEKISQLHTMLHESRAVS